MMPSKMQNLVAPRLLIPPPHMNFEWMLRFRLALCGLVRHSEAPATMRLEEDRALVAENHVLESVARIPVTSQTCHFANCHLANVLCHFANASKSIRKRLRIIFKKVDITSYYVSLQSFIEESYKIKK